MDERSERRRHIVVCIYIFNYLPSVFKGFSVYLVFHGRTHTRFVTHRSNTVAKRNYYVVVFEHHESMSETLNLFLLSVLREPGSHCSQTLTQQWQFFFSVHCPREFAAPRQLVHVDPVIPTAWRVTRPLRNTIVLVKGLRAALLPQPGGAKLEPPP